MATNRARAVSILLVPRLLSVLRVGCWTTRPNRDCDLLGSYDGAATVGRRLGALLLLYRMDIYLMALSCGKSRRAWDKFDLNAIASMLSSLRSRSTLRFYRIGKVSLDHPPRMFFRESASNVKSVSCARRENGCVQGSDFQ